LAESCEPRGVYFQNAHFLRLKLHKKIQKFIIFHVIPDGYHWKMGKKKERKCLKI
jgi:hypothetical protein